MLANYQDRIRTSKDPQAMGLLDLSELNVKHSIHGDLINQLYSWLIAQKTLAPDDVKRHDQHLYHTVIGVT
jgi:hypothetical protein